MTDVYTLDEVTRHNNAKDLWIVIDGGVYNLTEFHKEHPGGEEILLELAGQDATKCFDSIGHSYEAINLREKFKIGELMDDMSPEPKTAATNTEIKEPMEDWQYEEPKTEELPWPLIFITAAIAIYGIIIYYWIYYWKKL